VSRSDLLAAEHDLDATLGDTCARDLVTAASADSTADALRQMLDENVEHLPVLDAGHLVGICTRTDALEARRRQLHAEQAQPGWLRLAGRRPSTLAG
jgi:CBS-domain-containing membrane protein